MNLIRGHWSERWALEHQQVVALADVVVETGGEWPRSADSQLLDMSADQRLADRLVPVMRHGGLGGTIPGTDPLQALIRSWR